jgi:hypothetical protein
LDSFVRIETFQWVTAIPNQKIHAPGYTMPIAVFRYAHKEITKGTVRSPGFKAASRSHHTAIFDYSKAKTTTH